MEVPGKIKVLTTSLRDAVFPELATDARSVVRCLRFRVDGLIASNWRLPRRSRCHASLRTSPPALDSLIISVSIEA